MNKYQVSYIIPYRKSAEDRERNLALTLKWLGSNFPDYEIIIVEFDSTSKLNKSLLPANAKHIFHSYDGVFNRALARNIGALNASHDILAFSDNDIIMSPEDFSFCVEQCHDKYQAVNPYFVCIDLTEEELNTLDVEKNDLSVLYKPSESQKSEDLNSHREDLNFAGGNLIIRKKPFYYIGGWPEEMIGWGGEDDVISYKIDRFLTKKSFPNYIYHLPHARTVYDWYDHPEFKNNCDKMNNVFKLADDELIEYCEKSKSEILSSPYNCLKKEESEALLSYSLPAPRQISTLEQARREDDSVVAYPLIMD